MPGDLGLPVQARQVRVGADRAVGARPGAGAGPAAAGPAARRGGRTRRAPRPGRAPHPVSADQNAVSALVAVRRDVEADLVEQAAAARRGPGPTGRPPGRPGTGRTRSRRARRRPPRPRGRPGPPRRARRRGRPPRGRGTSTSRSRWTPPAPPTRCTLTHGSPSAGSRVANSVARAAPRRQRRSPVACRQNSVCGSAVASGRSRNSQVQRTSTSGPPGSRRSGADQGDTGGRRSAHGRSAGPASSRPSVRVLSGRPGRGGRRRRGASSPG